MWRQLTVVQEWPQARATLAQWRGSNWLRVVAPWFAVSACLAVLLLLLTYLIAVGSNGDTSGGGSTPSDMGERPGEFFLHIVRGNLLVLALHSLACLGGYIAHVVLPDQVVDHRTPYGMVHRWMTRAAVVFIPFATLFSIGTQSWVQGARTADLAARLGIPREQVLLSVLPHALPELTAVFLPLAAWLIASRRRTWHELLAAVILTTAIAVPIIGASAAVEVRRWPDAVLRLQEQRSPASISVGRLSVGGDPFTDTGVSTYLDAREVVSGPHPSEQVALVHARQASSSTRGGAVVVVRGAKGYEVRRLMGSDSPNFEARVKAGASQAAAPEYPFALRQISGRSLEERPPASVIAFVEGARVVRPVDLRPANPFGGVW